VAIVLGISADLLRWRIKAGKYPDPPRGSAGRRLFTIEDVVALKTAMDGRVCSISPTSDHRKRSQKTSI